MFKVEPVERVQAKLRLALTGVSHSGKTLSALKLAAGLGGKRIVVIDTEEPGCTVYQDKISVPFQMIKFKPPFTAERYVEAIHAAEQDGADIIIIDSFSHGWAGTGGLLERQSAIAEQSKSGNAYFAWREITPVFNKLIDTILQSTAHVIVCMRAKSQMEIVDIGGKKVPVKLGLEPIQRKDIEYEFTVSFKLEHGSNLYTIDKDVTGLFKGRSESISEETGAELAAWLGQGKEPFDLSIALKQLYDQAIDMKGLTEAYRSAVKSFGKQGLVVELAAQRKKELEHAEPTQNS